MYMYYQHVLLCDNVSCTHTFTLGIVFSFDHEAKVACASIHNRGVPSSRDGGLEVFLGESIIYLLLQAIVPTGIVRTAHPDLYKLDAKNIIMA